MSSPSNQAPDLDRIGALLTSLRGEPARAPDASIVVPVNAQADLDTVLPLLADLAAYRGEHRVEIVLVVNNFAPGEPPPAVRRFRDAGLEVVAVPSARKPGEVVIVSARAIGARAARSTITVHFDADCRVPDVTALLDWYVTALRPSCRLAYSKVDFYDTSGSASVRAQIAVHHAVRWVKRNLLAVPTTRGSNYAIDRDLFLRLYDAGLIAVDMQVGPAARRARAGIAYSGRRSHRVLTSGRKLEDGWVALARFLRYRLRYNLRAVTGRARSAASGWDGYDRESERRVGR